MKIKVNFEGCKTVHDIHVRLKNAFHFFDGYGENWSALWDCLYCWYDESTDIEIEGIQFLKENGLGEAAEKMLEIFNRVRKEGDPVYTTILS